MPASREREIVLRNPELEKLGELVGEWRLTMMNAWFLEPGFTGGGDATIQWLGDAFLEMRATLGDEGGSWHWVIGRNDAQDKFVLLYHDERGVLRVFDMTFSDGQWTLEREDPDFHQRFIARVTRDRIDGRWEASEDAGVTWRKDFDLIFEWRA